MPAPAAAGQVAGSKRETIDCDSLMRKMARGLGKLAATRALWEQLVGYWGEINGQIEDESGNTPNG